MAATTSAATGRTRPLRVHSGRRCGQPSPRASSRRHRRGERSGTRAAVPCARFDGARHRFAAAHQRPAARRNEGRARADPCALGRMVRGQSLAGRRRLAMAASGSGPVARRWGRARPCSCRRPGPADALIGLAAGVWIACAQREGLGQGCVSLLKAFADRDPMQRSRAADLCRAPAPTWTGRSGCMKRCICRATGRRRSSAEPSLPIGGIVALPRQRQGDRTVPSDPMPWSMVRTMLVSLIATSSYKPSGIELRAGARNDCGLAAPPGPRVRAVRADTGGRLPPGFDIAAHAGFGLSSPSGRASIGGSVRYCRKHPACSHLSGMSSTDTEWRAQPWTPNRPRGRKNRTAAISR